MLDNTTIDFFGKIILSFLRKNQDIFSYLHDQNSLHLYNPKFC